MSTSNQDILSFSSRDATLETVGGKGANLAHLAHAGFPVPNGFLVSTAVYRTFVAQNDLDRQIQAALTGLKVDDLSELEKASERIRSAFDAGAVTTGFRDTLSRHYHDLGEPAVAVRSSATAEDLPDMSFAGQQDTYLNVLGFDALLAAVIHCWSSLWTARAIGYRARNGVEQERVALAVVVQQMVQAEASGVLFTANPLMGRRTESVIDATLGLGEALVSGQVEPDHYIVDTTTRTILAKTLGAKATIITGQAGGGTITQRTDAAQLQAIPDSAIQALVELGWQVQSLYRAPQDIEWVWAGGNLHLVQSRPITSLFPLPAGLPYEPLKVLAAFSSVQGVFEPITPLGQDVMKLVLPGAGQVFGMDVTLENQTLLFSAAERLYINVTALLRNGLGRKILPRIVGALDPGVALAFDDVLEDPRLTSKGKWPGFATARRISGFALPTVGRIVRTWRDPDRARTQLLQEMDTRVAVATASAAPTGDLWIDMEQTVARVFAARDLFAGFVVPQALPVVIAGMIPFFGILQRIAAEAAVVTGGSEVAQLPLEIARSLPYNVTTEMDLELWAAAQQIRLDAPAEKAMRAGAPSTLAADYLEGGLPPVAQQAIASFMDRYGMRGPGEIDIGRPRWREQPEPIMQVLQSYLAIEDPAQAPDAIFARGAERAANATTELVEATRQLRGGHVKARLVQWAASRYRALAGLREAPKFYAIRMMGIIRAELLRNGARLSAAGLLQQPDDLFFLCAPELQQIAAARTVTDELRVRIQERRLVRQREMRRKQLPRVLLSDGTSYYEGVRAKSDNPNAIMGDPVSPGIAEGIVHVILDPQGAQLAPGEILVCTGTDPAWTPLFLAAGGLVMEVGGMMTHGSVVAREYGIPAVVGVHDATKRLETGMRILVDGSNGEVTILTN